MRITRISRTLSLAATLLTAGLLVSAASPDAGAAEGDLNACGCRQNSQGLCFCEKKSKCGCPGECEPNGCEERRAKQIDKEIQAETKKAEESSRRQSPNRAAGGATRSPASSNEEPDRGAGAASARSGPKMTAGQRKELARLLGLYLAEHPDDGNRPVEQVRSDVASRAK